MKAAHDGRERAARASRAGTRWLLLLAAGCGLGGGAGAAERFQSEAGRFRVLLPAEPVQRSHSRHTLLGRVSDVRYEAERNGASWAIETHDIPRGAELLMPAKFLLDRARRGFLADLDRKEIERIDTERRGHPAQRLRYLLPGDPERLRSALLVLVRSRLYIAISDDSPAARENLDPERFLASFDFWEEGGAPPEP